MAGETSTTLRYVDLPRVERVEDECSPQERRMLDTINQKVAAAESLEAVMTFLFDAIRAISACDRLGLAFLEEETARVVAHWTRADYEPVLLGKGYAEGLRGSSLEAVLRNGTPRVINDLEAYLDQHPDSRSTRIIVREGVRSSMTCPLVVEGRPVGFLFRSSRRPHAYDDHQVRMHQAVAERLSQAVEKAYRIEQLTAANQAYFETLGFVSHELRSPLSSLVMDGDLLMGGYTGELAPQHRQKVERMMAKARYLLGLIDEYMNLAQVEGGQLDAQFEQTADFVAALVEPAIEIVQAQLDAKHMTLKREWPDRPVALSCDPTLMKIVLVNLLSNAAKYGDENGEVRLRVEETPDGVTVSVRNTGPGFPEEQRAKLFRRFSRVNTPELMKRKGSGIGLYTTWRIVQLHGGRIRAESEEGQWAEFSFKIPTRPDSPEMP